MIKLTQQPYTTKDRNTLINIDTARVTLASEYSSSSWCFELFLSWTPKPEKTGAIISPDVIVVRIDQDPTPLLYYPSWPIYLIGANVSPVVCS